MPRTIHTVSSGFFDVNGNAIASLSTATVLEGYSGPVNCKWAEAVWFEIRDVATGASVAPTAITVEGKAFADSVAWIANDNYNGWKKNTGIAANFIRSGARFVVVPFPVEVTIPLLLISNELIRLKIVVPSSANLFTPTIRAHVLRGDTIEA